MPRNVKPKNAARNEVAYTNYRQYWGLIPKHLANRSYVEVITSVEKIILARLWTFLNELTPHNTGDMSYHDSTFKGLIKLWKKYEPLPIKDKRFDDLQQAVEKWREKRNRGAHAGLKRVQGQKLLAFDELQEKNKAAAEEGILIAKSVQNWLDRVKYRAEKKEGKSLTNPRHK